MPRRTDPACRAGTPIPAEPAKPAPAFGRKHLRRLDRLSEELPGPLFFITCCVKGRRKVLANDVVAPVLVSAWTTSPDAYGWGVGRYVVMPDHVHFFATPCRDGAKDLPGFIRCWKRWTRRTARLHGGPSFSWQLEFFDHVLRSGESYAEKWEYIRQNPVRAGLASSPEAWRYHGELTRFSW